MIQLIKNRIGLETLTEGLNNISKSEFYVHSAKHPQLVAKHSSDLIFDHAFCRLFKKYESLILLQLNEPNNPYYFPMQNHGQEQTPRDHHHPNYRDMMSGGGSDLNRNGYMVNDTRQSNTDVINRYKELIMEQDQKMEVQKQQLHACSVTNQEYKVIKQFHEID